MAAALVVALVSLSDHYRIVIRALNDATVASRAWNPGQTTSNARAAIQDPSTIGYIGDLNSGATAVAIPLLNRAGTADQSHRDRRRVDPGGSGGGSGRVAEVLPDEGADVRAGGRLVFAQARRG